MTYVYRVNQYAITTDPETDIYAFSTNVINITDSLQDYFGCRKGMVRLTS